MFSDETEILSFIKEVKVEEELFKNRKLNMTQKEERLTDYQDTTSSKICSFAVGREKKDKDLIEMNTEGFYAEIKF